MKRALVVSAIFPPEPVVSAQTSAQIAAALVERGYAVRVIAPFPNRPGGVLYPGFRRRIFSRQQSGRGYEILRCFSTLSRRSTLLSRFMENLTFGLTSGLAVLFSRDVALIYANTWPLFAGGILAMVARLRRIPLVISVQDVYPESLLAQGRLEPDGLLTRLLGAVDAWIARSARGVIVISPRFAAIYRRRGVAASRLHPIPNWVARTQIDVSVRSESLRQRLCIPPDRFVLVYAGNVGVAAGLENLVRQVGAFLAAYRMHLLIAGEGSRLDAVRTIVAGLDNRHISIYSPWPVEENSLVLRGADLLLLPTRGEQSLASVPSKLISYMLAGRPVLALARPGSEVTRIIREARCGWLGDPDRLDDLPAMLAAIRALSSGERERIGAAGRTYALRHFTDESCLPRVLAVLESAAR